MTTAKFKCLKLLALAATTLVISLPSSAQSALTRPIDTKTAIAQSKAFRPPSNPRRSRGHSTTTGTRQGSCVGNTETDFTILGPSTFVGLSASNRPEFVWSLPPADEAYPVTFRLLALNADGLPELIYTGDVNYKSGITKYTLPTDVADLSPGTEYRWQVIVVCDENYLSRSINQERAFEVVLPDAELQQSLRGITTNTQRAIAYGEAGFWYDAIAQVAQSNNPEEQSMFRALLEDLAAVEAETPESVSFSENLLSIANTL